MDAAPLLRAIGEKRPEKGLHVGIAPPVHQQPETMTAANECERRFRRAEQHDARYLRRRRPQTARMGFGLPARIGGDNNRGKTPEWRQDGFSRSTISLS